MKLITFSFGNESRTGSVPWESPCYTGASRAGRWRNFCGSLALTKPPMKRCGSGTISSGSEAALRSVEAAQADDSDRRDENQGRRNVVLPLGGGRHGEPGTTGVALTPTRDGHDASRFIRRVLRTCTNTPTVLVDGGPWYPKALHRLGVPWMGTGDVREAECG